MAISAAAVAQPVRGDDGGLHQWLNPLGGGFEDRQNWDKGVPGSLDTAVFNLDRESVSVFFGSNSINHRLRIIGGDFTFNLEGYTYELTDPGSISGSGDDAGIVVGGHDDATASLTLIHGTIAGVSTQVGGPAGAIGTITVADDALLHVGQTLHISKSGTVNLDGGTIRFDAYTRQSGGIFNYLGGTIQLAGSRIIGTDPAILDLYGLSPNIGSDFGMTIEGFAAIETDVTVTGGTLRLDDQLHVSSSGDGMLTISNGGTVFGASDATIGSSSSSTGMVTVTGPGSTWSVTGDRHIGGAGTGTLMISDGGHVSDFFGNLGADTGSVGTAKVSGAGSLWTSGFIRVGFAGDGRLTIEEGGTVSTINGSIGFFSDGIGHASVSGADSVWTNSGGLEVGRFGAGTLTVGDGGQVSNRFGWLGLNSASTGSVLVTGTGSRWTNTTDLRVGSSGHGTLTIESGGEVSSPNAGIGFTTDGIGRVTVTGVGSHWTNTGEIIIAHSGHGTLTILEGGQFSSGEARMAVGETGIGRVFISGTGSQWRANGPLRVGQRGNGEVTISDGGQVTSMSSVIGMFPGSTGAVTVTGQGSVWHTGTLSVGNEGEGSLTISDGGSVISGAVMSAIGGESGSIGSVMVIGENALWDKLSLTIGLRGDGTLTISDGGHVSNRGGQIASSAGSTGMVTVTGSDSTWASALSVYIGGTSVSAGGNASVILGPGGHMSVGGDLKLWDNPLSDVENLLTFQLSGASLEYRHGTITVHGNAALGDRLAVELIDGYLPLPGESFQVLAYGSRSGQFRNTIARTKIAGLWFELDYEAEGMALRAAAIAGDANLDGAVTIADLGILAANWQQSDRSWFHGDFNYDGEVTIADLGILAANWQAGAAGASSLTFAEALAMLDIFDSVTIPEPAGLGLLAMFGLMCRRLCRR